EAPASSTRRPATDSPKASSALASFVPPRETYWGPAPRTVIGSPVSTRRADVVAGIPATATRPSPMRRAAAVRESARPRRTSSTSSRRLPTATRIPSVSPARLAELPGSPRLARLRGHQGGDEARHQGEEIVADERRRRIRHRLLAGARGEAGDA